MPYAPSLQHLLPVSPAIWVPAAGALLILRLLAIRGIILAVMDDLGNRRRNRTGRRNRSDPKTMTIAHIETTADYQAATPEQRAALDRLDPATELVRKDGFGEHAISVTRDMIGDERCNRWPYRNIDLEDATEDLRASYASIEIGRSTYYYPRSEGNEPQAGLQCLLP